MTAERSIGRRAESSLNLPTGRKLSRCGLYARFWQYGLYYNSTYAANERLWLLSGSAFGLFAEFRARKPVGSHEAVCENAMQVAAMLEKAPQVESVSYPGLPSSPDHELAKNICLWAAAALLRSLLKEGAKMQ